MSKLNTTSLQSGQQKRLPHAGEREGSTVLFIICWVEWGARAGPESLKIQKYPCILHDLFRGRLVELGAWAGLESLKIRRYLFIFHDLFGGLGGMGKPKIIENTTASLFFS